MVYTRVFLLCLCACFSATEGARTQTRAVEAALKQASEEEDSEKVIEGTEMDEMDDEMEDEMEDLEEDGSMEREDLQPAGCKNWCKKIRVGFPIDLEWVKQQTEAKCANECCKDCAGGGLTIPDCREKKVACDKEENATSTSEEDVTAKEENDVTAKEENVATTSEEDLPKCSEKPKEFVKACTVKEGGAELTCTYANTPWCAPPSRNPGPEYRLGSKPLCCETEQAMADCNMANVKAECEKVKKVLENEKDCEKKDEPPAPLPQCACNHTFEVDSFMRKGKMEHACRDTTTGKFAKKVCCEEELKQLLQDEEKAEEECPKVQDKYCRGNIFEKKRKSKYPNVPSTFTCKKMYMCSKKGEECFGPVPNPSWCAADKTGLPEDRPAVAKCVAVKL